MKALLLVAGLLCFAASSVAAVDCSQFSDSTRSQCEGHSAQCQWCENTCAQKSAGACCPSPKNPCNARYAFFCKGKTPHCSIQNVTANGGTFACMGQQCCPEDKRDLCGGGPTCFNQSTGMCCSEKGSTGGEPTCPQGKACCFAKTSKPYDLKGHNVCCDKQGESCKTSEYGNFCAKRNQTGVPCNDDLNELECIQSSQCIFCGGRCSLRTSNRMECCEVSPRDQCLVDGQVKPYARACDLTNSVCATSNGSCTVIKCCPAHKPHLCWNAGCYNNETETCCGNARGHFIGPKGSVCCPAGLCPPGTTKCCGATTLACCNSTYPTCNDDQFKNYCEP